MFEKYTERARRVIFFARYESSQLGSPCIETEHLLLGLLREDQPLISRFLRSQADIESIRKPIEGRARLGQKISTSVDLPLSHECKRVLAYSAEEAMRLSHNYIGTEHLLMGLLREDKSFAAEILHERGLTLSEVREHFRGAEAKGESVSSSKATSLLSELSRDLTQAALDNELEPLIEREEQLETVIHTLSRRKTNVLLVGERGVGKRSLVHGLAQRLALGSVPPELEGKRLLAVDFSPTLAVTGGGRQLEARVLEVMEKLNKPAQLIVYIEDVIIRAGGGRSLNTLNLLKPLLMEGEIQCIAAATPAEGRQWLTEEVWRAAYFKAVEIPAPNEAIALKVLAAVRPRYEAFHNVVYSDEALRYAVLHSQRFIPDRCLPDKAIDLLDEAGAAVAVRAGNLPEEVAEAQRRLKSAARGMEQAIASHEFEKARFFDEEERKEREAVRLLRQKYNLGQTGTVTVDDIEGVVARMTGVAIAAIRDVRHQDGQSASNGPS